MHPAMLDVRGDGRTTGRGPVRQPRRGSAAREHVIVIAQHVVRAAAAAAGCVVSCLSRHIVCIMHADLTSETAQGC